MDILKLQLLVVRLVSQKESLNFFGRQRPVVDLYLIHSSFQPTGFATLPGNASAIKLRISWGVDCDTRRFDEDSDLLP